MIKRYRCPHGHISEIEDNGFVSGIVTFSPNLIAYCANCEHRIDAADEIDEYICISEERVI